MKFTSHVLERYERHCYKSFHKCNNVEEVKEKIERAIALGKKVKEQKSYEYYLYGNRIFVYDPFRDMAINIFPSNTKRFYFVSEEQKNEYLMKKVFQKKEKKSYVAY